ncbi:Glycosyl hydrolase, five-bladed beta-propellor domain containing protein [Amanita muscaria]
MRSLASVILLYLSSVATSAQNNPSSNDEPAQPVFPETFADPAFVRDPKTNYFWAFSTSEQNVNVQVALSTDNFNTFAFQKGMDALPHTGNWTASNPQVWAPDVVHFDNLRSPFDGLKNEPGYVMYYSARSSQNSNLHCVGTAYSRQPQGPYKASPKPLVCPLDQGGAIDPNGFRDPATGKQYVLYKVDGSAIGSGGLCGNSNPNQKPTPIRIQEVNHADGATLIGDYVEIANGIFPEDVACVEAPSLLSIPNKNALNGYTYILFFSSGCYSDPSYDVKYATSITGILHSAVNTNGPAVSHYDRAPAPLLATGDYGLVAPGGLYAGPGGVNAIWHSTNTSLPGLVRQLHKARLNVNGITVTLV